ncbi:MAG: carboxypeptidase regulatory-like domain-containing protein [Acidobacteria bacterium]|nr:carboxypeptidase regulatory-like domain-containing protein [Acidobacteriota bacterium]
MLNTAIQVALLLVAGCVTDESGQRLPGVSVTLRAPDATVVADIITDESGSYRLLAAPGRYELRFSLVNFGEVVKPFTAAGERVIVVDAVLPLTFFADVVVSGRRTFRNLAEVEDPGASLIGLASAASEGAVTARQIEHRPLLRPGEVLETVPGLVISQHSGEGKAIRIPCNRVRCASAWTSASDVVSGVSRTSPHRVYLFSASSQSGTGAGVPGAGPKMICLVSSRLP